MATEATAAARGRDERRQLRAERGFLINGSVNNGAATPLAQSAAFGNNRRGPSLYNSSLGW
jgi:hypothetical protein